MKYYEFIKSKKVGTVYVLDHHRDIPLCEDMGALMRCFIKVEWTGEELLLTRGDETQEAMNNMHSMYLDHYDVYETEIEVLNVITGLIDAYIERLNKLKGSMKEQWLRDYGVL